LLFISRLKNPIYLNDKFGKINILIKYNIILILI